MALFKNFLLSVEEAWDAIANGAIVPNDHLLFAADTENNSRQIIWMERLRQFALEQDGDVALLDQFEDFRKTVGERRPDPTVDQWLWLYTQIGARRQGKNSTNPIGIMAGRDALLPFIASVPDRVLWYKFGDGQGAGEEPLPYQGLEDAIQADAPSQVAIIRMLCRNVSSEDVLNRALYLEKTAVVASMLKTLPTEQKVTALIAAHTTWQKTAPLVRYFREYEDEIAAWRDAWGNGFFWYLYRRPTLEETTIQSLPDKIVKTFAVKNSYGFAPEDLWIYYRPLAYPIENESDS